MDLTSTALSFLPSIIAAQGNSRATPWPSTVDESGETKPDERVKREQLHALLRSVVYAGSGYLASRAVVPDLPSGVSLGNKEKKKETQSILDRTLRWELRRQVGPTGWSALRLGENLSKSADGGAMYKNAEESTSESLRKITKALLRAGAPVAIGSGIGAALDSDSENRVGNTVRSFVGSGLGAMGGALAGGTALSYIPREHAVARDIVSMLANIGGVMTGSRIAASYNKRAPKPENSAMQTEKKSMLLAGFINGIKMTKKANVSLARGEHGKEAGFKKQGSVVDGIAGWRGAWRKGVPLTNAQRMGRLADLKPHLLGQEKLLEMGAGALMSSVPSAMAGALIGGEGHRLEGAARGAFGGALGGGLGTVAGGAIGRKYINSTSLLHALNKDKMLPSEIGNSLGVLLGGSIGASLAALNRGHGSSDVTML